MTTSHHKVESVACDISAVAGRNLWSLIILFNMAFVLLWLSFALRLFVDLIAKYDLISSENGKEGAFAAEICPNC